MLRRTAAKAFGSGEQDSAPVAPAPHETRRGEAVARLFRELQASLESHAEAPARAPAGEAEGEAEGATPRGLLEAGLQVSKPRALRQGLEFELSGPGGAFAFLDTLCGYVVACQKSGERVLPREILSVELQAGAFRPIRKPAGSSDGRRRRPYRFTSVPEVARDYIGLAKSIHKIDTSPWVP